MAVFKEFKEFAVRGNVIDMGVGIIIGAGFGAIVKSLVDDIIMPPVGLLLGDVDFRDLFIELKQGSPANYTNPAEAKAAGAVTLNYGVFINTILTFIIVAFAVFLLVKQINRLRRKKSDPESNTKECPQCMESVDIKALRCKHCTSPLTGAASEPTSKGPSKPQGAR